MASISNRYAVRGLGNFTLIKINGIGALTSIFDRTLTAGKTAIWSGGGNGRRTELE